MTRDKILLFSGGIDSLVAYHYLDKPQTVYFNLKNRYADKEIKVVKDLVPDTIIDNSLNLWALENPVSGYIPFRNLHIACLAARYADTIVIAGVADDRVSDKNEEIFREFSSLLSKLEGRRIEVMSPFWGMTKAQVVSWYIKHVGDVQRLTSAVSCYSTDQFYCAKCTACFRKWLAFYQSGIKMDFKDYKLMRKYYHEAFTWIYYKVGKGVHPDRAEATLKYVKEYLESCGERP